MAKRIANRLLILIVLLLLVGCDHASKGVAKAEFGAGGALEVVRGLISLCYVENTDIAFNLLRSIPEAIRFPALLVSGAVAVLGLLFLVFRTRWSVSVPLVALLLVTAGAIGNYLDRVCRGYVVDFVQLPHWPVFNIADVYITVGGMVLACAVLVRKKSAPPVGPTQ